MVAHRGVVCQRGGGGRILCMSVVRPIAVLTLVLAFACAANADDSLQWSGFALLRGASSVDAGPLRQEQLSTQVQLGLDWLHSPVLGAHVHLLARDDNGHSKASRRGTLGVAEAYVEMNLTPGSDRVRLRGGAMFLPTSRENIDALWENPYTITSSALNSWLGEELRPIGIDASWFRRGLFAGTTVFRGNDTFGALPAARGWSLDDHWTLLGERVPVDPDYVTSVSAENDDRLGWSARGGWNGPHLLVQLTHIDNRSDGREYGELFNWGTDFDIVAVEYTVNDWTIAAESGWGPTFLIVDQKYTDDLRASYLLVSRAWSRSRASLRFDDFAVDDDGQQAWTFAYLWTPVSKLRVGAEVATTGGERRVLVELRYRFSAQ